MSVVYCIVMMVLLIVSMFFTGSSPGLLISMISEGIETLFPFISYVKTAMPENRLDSMNAFFFMILIDWFTAFISNIMSTEEEDPPLFLWVGNTCFALILTAFASKLNRLGISTGGIAAYFSWAIILGAVFVICLLTITKMGDKNNKFGLIGAPFIYSCKVMWYLLLLPIIRLILPMLALLAIVLVFSLIPISLIQTVLSFVAILGMFFIKGFTDQLADKIPVSHEIITGRFIIIVVIIIANIWLICGNSLPFLDTFLSA